VIGRSDRAGRWRRPCDWIVEPDEENGLRNATAFELAPRYFRSRRVALLCPDRNLGHLRPAQVREMHDELVRILEHGLGPLDDEDEDV